MLRLFSLSLVIFLFVVGDLVQASSTYAYPFDDPYFATATVEFLRGKKLHRGVEAKEFYIEILPGRNSIPLMEGKGRIHGMLYRQRHPAPLLFFVPGTGEGAFGGYQRFLGELFYERGFHVVFLPGTSNWNFALAASSTGLTGVKEQDAKDLYRVMQMTLRYLKGQYALQVGQIGFVGTSMGAMDGAYIHEEDKRQGALGISRFLLINPPVDLLYSAQVVDGLLDESKGWSKSQRDVIMGRAGLYLEDFFRDHLDTRDISVLMNLPGKIPFTRSEVKFLIGTDFRISIGGVIYVSQLMKDRHILKTPAVKWKVADRVEEARSFSIQDYVSRFLLPTYEELTAQTLTVQQLGAKSSLRGLHLESAPEVYVMHNADDFLVNREQLSFLQNTLGSRLKLYPKGGHMGNIWFPENTAAILDTFSDLTGRN